MKKVVKITGIIFCSGILLSILYFTVAFFGNPVSMTLARNNTLRYLEENLSDTDFQITKVGYNFKTGGYYAFIESPSSQDSYFTIHFDSWGQYSYDTYNSITDGSTTFARLNSEYWDLVKTTVPHDQFDISIFFGELRASDSHEVFTYTNEDGKVTEYTLTKNYGLDKSQLVLDGEYDVRQLGRDHGSICLYIHDPEVTTQRAAELLLEVKAYLDEQGVPFHAIDFHLCEPLNEEGQNAGNQITLFGFAYSDIHEDGLLLRVEQHWNIAQDHYSIQDEEKAYTDSIFP